MIESVNPTTEEVLASFDELTPEDIEGAISHGELKRDRSSSTAWWLLTHASRSVE